MPERQVSSHVDNKWWCSETRTWQNSPARMAVMRQTGHDAKLPDREAKTQNGALIRSNAKKATMIRAALLDAIEARIQDIAEKTEDPVEAASLIAGMTKADVLRLLTDSEDRGYGKPTQKQELAHSLSKRIEEEMTPEEAADIYAREISRA